MMSRKLGLSAIALAFLGASSPAGAASPPRPADAPSGAEIPGSDDDAEDVALSPPLPDASTPLTLDRVMALAKEHAPSVASARAEVGVARSGFVGARLNPLTNPYLEIIASRGTLGATKDVAVQGNLFLPLEVSGQRSKRIAEVEALVMFQEASLETMRAAAAADAVRAFGSAAVAATRVEVYGGIVAVARTEAEVYEARLKAGDTTEQDAKLAKVELAKNVVSLAEGHADLARALTDLQRVTGVRVAAPAASSAAPPKAAASVSQASAVAAAERAPLVQASRREALLHARGRERQRVEAHAPLNLIVTAGRGDLGELRAGGGVAWSFPISRRNQGEQARAAAERSRALIEGAVRRRTIAFALEGLANERTLVRHALAELDGTAEPAAQAAVDAAVAMQRAGKADLLHVLTARRDLSVIRVRRLDLLQREWSIVSDIVALTGELP